VRQSDWKIIRALPLFCDMSEENFEKLVGAAFLQRFPLHTTLINEGDLPDFLHIVVDGSVEMFCTHDRHETTIEIMRPVTTFILAAVIRDDVYLKSARTLTPAQILMIPAQTVRDVFDRDAAFARILAGDEQRSRSPLLPARGRGRGRAASRARRCRSEWGAGVARLDRAPGRGRRDVVARQGVPEGELRVGLL